MSGYFASPAYYFKFKGEVNTRRVLEVAVNRAKDLSVRAIIVASETERNALKALEVIKRHGPTLKLVVVTHPPDKTWRPKGDIPIGLNHPRYRKIREYLEKAGAIIVQGTRPFAPASRSLGWEKALPDTLIDFLIGGVFGQGVKVAIEAAVMAADAGAVSRGDVVVSLDSTYKGLDSAIVARTTYSYYFLKEFEVLEIIAKPWRHRVTLPEYKDPGWRGDLDLYYENPTRWIAPE